MAKRLQASQFPGLIPEAQKNIKNVETVAKIVANVEEQASVTKKQGRAKSKKETFDSRGRTRSHKANLITLKSELSNRLKKGSMQICHIT